jgi:D-alanine-D-alanine ligase
MRGEINREVVILRPMSKLNLLLLFGGESAEHEVSIRSARSVFDAFDKEKYEVRLCYIDRDGRWWYAADVSEDGKTDEQLEPMLGEQALKSQSGKVRPDVIVPILHGPNGEDGSVQGLARLLHIPILGCGILGSAICMDKDVAKRLLLQAGVPVVKTRRRTKRLPLSLGARYS